MVEEADAFLRLVRFGRDGSELTTRAYAGGIALFLRWCARSGRHWHVGVEHLGLFITWLQHAGPQVSGVDAASGGQVLAGPGRAPVRGPRRVNAVLCAVRGFVAHAVSCGQAPAGLLAVIYELADERDLPEQARGEDARMAWRMRARHRLREPDTDVDRAGDEQIVALLAGMPLGAGPADRVVDGGGLRRGEVCGLRRSDVHLLLDSRALGCEVARAHLHVVRRANQNGAWAKSRRRRVVPLDFLHVQAFDTYEFERWGVPRAGESDFVLVNLFREPVGAPMRPDAINELMTGCSRRAGLDPPLRPHQLRHAFGSNLADAGGGLDEIAELLGHTSMSSSQVYLHQSSGIASGGRESAGQLVSAASQSLSSAAA